MTTSKSDDKSGYLFDKLPAEGDVAGDPDNPATRETKGEKPWLGLVMDHRRLFDALQDGWLRPLPPDAGLLVGVGSYVGGQHTEGNRISVRVRLNAEKLPNLAVTGWRSNDGWQPCDIDKLTCSDFYIHWPGILPTFAISDLSVATEEEAHRLEGLARQVSNVPLPTKPAWRDMEAGPSTPPPDPPSDAETKLTVPLGMDSTQGAMSMAMWAVPRIDPWLDVLVESFALSPTRMQEFAAKVEARWWRFPPWAASRKGLQPSSFQEGLWLAAVGVLGNQAPDDRPSPLALAERIAAQMTFPGLAAPQDEASAWREDTRRILRAEATIRSDYWRDCPVGMAVQMVLARLEPMRFKTWSRDMPGLPPAVWWSGAVLCGLHHGYRRLDSQFRGPADLCEALSVQALRLCAEEVREICWPSIASAKPRWERRENSFALFWGDREIDEKRIHERGRWISANFDDEKVRQGAENLARKLSWPCLRRRVRLSDGRFPVSGDGKVQARDGELAVRGNVAIEFPSDAIEASEDVLDVESFRHQIAVAAGKLPEPPVSRQADTPKESTIPCPVDAPGPISEGEKIHGLTYVPDFITEAEERELVEKIDGEDWSTELQRRVQHYGWRYDYKARHVDESMRLGDLPEWAADIARRLVERKLVPTIPDQVIVNEYVGEQGISKHVDSKQSFADGIATLSLLESWEMVFRKKYNGKVVRRLEQRSLAIMQGEARYQWTHEIPQRKSEPNEGSRTGRWNRNRRLSLTFRKVLDENAN